MRIPVEGKTKMSRPAARGERASENTHSIHPNLQTIMVRLSSSSSALLLLGPALLALAGCVSHADAFNPLGQQGQNKNKQQAAAQVVAVEDADSDALLLSSRRSFLAAMTVTASSSLLLPQEASGKEVDCFQDCFKNCKQIAPKDQQYCLDTCKDYCDQTDRRDGLSGSVSSEGGETGILGLNTVVKGEDKPPEIKIPGLDFSSGSGKKLIGY